MYEMRETTGGREADATQDLPVRVNRAWRRLLRDKITVAALIYFAIIIPVTLLAPQVAPHAPTATVGPPLLGPSPQFWLGTDELGRDLLSRLIWGGRVSLTIGIFSTMLAMVFGIPVGLVAGYYSRLDTVLMRAMDCLLAFPPLMLALAVAAVLGPGITHEMLAIGVVSVPVYARLVRAVVLNVKHALFVEASRAVGVADHTLLWKVILPEAISPLTVQVTLSFAYAILTDAGLSFLGLGVVPPTPSWGAMLNTGRQYLLQAPLYSVSAGAAVFLTVLSLNLIGDALRDALDPHQLTVSRHT